MALRSCPGSLITHSCRAAARWIAAFLLLFVCVASAGASTEAPTFAPCPASLALSAEQIANRLMSHNAERARDLISFEGVRQYELKYTGLPYPQSAEMRVRVAYAAPGTKKFSIISQSGSKLILDKVLHRLLTSEKEASSDEENRDTVALSTQNYHFTLLGCDPDNGRPQYVMQVDPVREDKFLYRGNVWIDPHDFAVTRIEAEPAKNPSFWIKRSQISHRYEKVGPFYLPKSNETVTDVRFGGTAILTIRYLDYKLPQLSATKAGMGATQ